MDCKYIRLQNPTQYILGNIKTTFFSISRSHFPLSIPSLFVMLFFSKSKKELPLVAFFCQEKIQQSFTRLSITIGASGAVVKRSFGFLKLRAFLS